MPVPSSLPEPLNLTVARYVRPFKAIPGSFQPGRIALGVLLVAALMCLGGLWDGVMGHGRLGVESGVAGAGEVPRGTFAISAEVVVQCVDRIASGVVGLRPVEVMDALATLWVRLPLALWRFDPAFLIGFGLISVAVASIFCGALARMSIIEAATGSRLPASEGLTFAVRAWPRLAGSVLLPMLLVAFVALLLLVPALLLRVPVLNIIAALFHGLSLLLSLLAVFVAGTTLLVLPLLAPAVAAERDDAIEAVQRCVSYLLVRPLHLALLAAGSIVAISLGYLVVSALASGTVLFAGASLDAWAPLMDRPLDARLGLFHWPSATGGVDQGAVDLGSTAALARRIVGWWELLLLAIVAGWMVSAIMSCAAQSYLAVRESADGQDPEEVWGLGQ